MSNTQSKNSKRRGGRTTRNKKTLRQIERAMVKKVVKFLPKQTPNRSKNVNMRQRRPPSSMLAKQLTGGLRHGIGRTLREEPSAAAWPSVYVDPFLQIDARLPIWPVRSTLCQMRKATIMDGIVNANGNGWIAFQPANMICNDLDFAFYSTAASGDQILQTANNSIRCSGAYDSNSFLEGGYSMRIVAFGFKVRYTGTELNKGGFITFHQMCPRQSVNGLTASDIQSTYTEWKQVPFDNKLKMFTRLYTENDDSLYMNLQILEETFPQWSYDDFATNNSENQDYICAYISGATAGQKFEVQVAAHYEIIGPVNNTVGVRSTTLNTQKHEKVINLAATNRSKDNSTLGVSVGELVGAGLALAGL